MGWLSSLVPGLLLASLPVLAQDLTWLTRQVSSAPLRAPSILVCHKTGCSRAVISRRDRPIFAAAAEGGIYAVAAAAALERRMVQENLSFRRDTAESWL